MRMAYADISQREPYHIQQTVDFSYFPNVSFLSIEENRNELDMVTKIDLLPLHIKTHAMIDGNTFLGELIAHLPEISCCKMVSGWPGNHW